MVDGAELRSLLVLTTVRSLAIPVCRTITFNHMTRSTGNGNIMTRDDNRIEVVIEGVTERLMLMSILQTKSSGMTYSGTCEGDCSTGLKALQINCARRRGGDVGKHNVCARLHSR